MEDMSLYLLGFLSLFHILGAAAMGSAVRGIWRVIGGQEESVFGYLFFLIFGGMFGCFPLAFGLQGDVPLWVFQGQLLILGITFLTAAFLGPTLLSWLRSLFNINTGLIILGLAFITAGLFGGYMMLNQGEEVTPSLMVGIIFGLIGVGIILLGIINLFRNRSS